MMIQVSSPQILSPFCSEFSGIFDPAKIDPLILASEKQITLPKNLHRAVPKRQIEYLMGRIAAAAALKNLGFKGRFDLSSFEDRSPAWPEGYVGSITHTSNFVSVAVARASDVLALGRDSETLLDHKTANEIQDTTLLPSEKERLEASGLSLALYVGLIFSAKESLFKALAPRVKKMFSFEDAEVLEISKEGMIRFKILSNLSREFPTDSQLTSRYQINEYIHTSVEILTGSTQP